jgi:TetR/AcrR family transcriptional repressor of nem operon
MTGHSGRAQLIEVGLQLFHSAGYTSTGIKEILDRAGVPKGSFYHYFSSKEVFAEEVLKSYAASLDERVRTCLGDRTLAPLARLRKYFDILRSVYGRSGPIPGCLLGYLSLELSDDSPSLQALLSNVFGRWQLSIAGVLQEAKEQGALSCTAHPDELAAFLLNGWEGALIRMRAEKSDAPLTTFIYIALDVLLIK